MSNRVTVVMDADNRGLVRGVDQSRGKLSGLRGAVSGLGGLLKGALVVGGIQAVGQAFGDVVGEAREAQKVGALTSSVIKSTGGAANVTAKQVGDLSEAISNKAGVDDEAVQTGANLLLTFKNVRNEAGKGNKIFDQATRSAVDLSAAGFGSIDSASKMLGKALNDPIKGISALGRAGVTFTKGQQKQIKSMVEAGDTLGAQKIILGEVKSQVGGAAAATATSGEKLSVMWGNIKEQVGTALLPVLDKVARFLLANLPGAIEKTKAAFGAIKDVVGPVVAAVRGFLTGMSGGGEASGKLRQLQTTFTEVTGSIRSIISSTVSIVRSLWARFGSDITRYVSEGLGNALRIVRGVFNVLAGIFKTVAALLRGDWKGAWEGIKQTVRGAVQVVVGVVRQAFNLARLVVTVAVKAIAAVVRSVFSGVRSLVSSAASAVASLVRDGFNRARDAVSGALGTVLDKVRGLKGNITGALSGIGSWLLNAGKDLIRGLIGGITSMATEVANKAADVAKGAIGAAKNALGIASPSKVFHQLGVFVGRGLARGMLASSSTVRATGAQLAKMIRDAFTKEAITEKQARRGLAVADRYTKALARVATARARVATKLATQQARLADLVKARNDYAANVARSARDFASVTAIEPGENQTLTASTITQGLRDRLNAVKNYTSKLAALARSGLNKTTYDQLVQAGVEGGTATVEALYRGGRTAVVQVNSLQSQINRQAGVLGRSTAGTMYNAGINAAAGLVRGLQSQSAALIRTATTLARRMVKAVRKALGIKSPSRVFMGVADQVTRGLTIGLDSGRQDVQRGAVRLADALTTGFDVPQLGATSATAGTASGPTIIIERLEVHSGWSNPTEVARAIDKMLREAAQGGFIRTAGVTT